MSRIVAALVAAICMVTVSSIATPADAARPVAERKGVNDYCC